MAQNISSKVSIGAASHVVDNIVLLAASPDFEHVQLAAMRVKAIPGRFCEDGETRAVALLSHFVHRCVP